MQQQPEEDPAAQAPAVAELDDLNIDSQHTLAPPAALKQSLAVPAGTAASIRAHRAEVRAILDGSDQRLLVVTGPCSIHNTAEALEYAQALRALAREVEDRLLLVMRAYFEKPRTTVGWKGLINDPFLDGSFRIEAGLRLARQLLLDISALGLPLGTEALDPITPQYLQDLISWTAIGARTTESQTHREMASGLSSPVGFKNGTDGGLEVALNAMRSAREPHRFLGINGDGRVAITTTNGNSAAHVVLRGGSDGPNYDSDSVARCEAALNAAGLPARIMIDCSHANSSKDHERQAEVAADVARQIAVGNHSIIGLMLESNLAAGRQNLETGKAPAPGVSITDACIDFERTREIVLGLHRQLAEPLRRRRAP